MNQFLIDENLSPLIAYHLRRLGYKAKTVPELNLKGKTDQEIIEFAKKNGWIIITGDQEFGLFFYENFGEISIIVLKSLKQSVSSFKALINFLHKKKILKRINPKGWLVIVTPRRIRVRLMNVE
jgi:predicted nuclease of predicted toxin-antitoxin system